MRDNSVTFNIDVEGDITGTRLKGNFKAKVRLTHRDQMQKDKIRRELLGEKPEAASVRSINQAEIFSQLAVRLVDAPIWWKESGNGLDLEDDNVIAVVFEGALQVEADAASELRKKAEDAKAALVESK